MQMPEFVFFKNVPLHSYFILFFRFGDLLQLYYTLYEHTCLCIYILLYTYNALQIMISLQHEYINKDCKQICCLIPVIA